MTVERYHPLLVVLHWGLAVLIIAAVGVGYFELAPTPNSDPRKLDLLEWHMAGGMLIAGLMLVRLVVRWRTAHPAPATTGHALLDRVASACHYSFYVLVLLMAATGLATAILAKLNVIVFARSGEPLPVDITIYPTRIAHGVLAAMLVTLIALHIAAVGFHHLIRRDGVFRRMSWPVR